MVYQKLSILRPAQPYIYTFLSTFLFNPATIFSLWLSLLLFLATYVQRSELSLISISCIIPLRYTIFNWFSAMSPAMVFEVRTEYEDGVEESHDYHKGVKHLCEKGIKKVPRKYILPAMDRPVIQKDDGAAATNNLKLPVIDLAQLQGPNRIQALQSLSKACEEYGFFQLIHHGIASESILKMIAGGRKFFELPFEERSKYMSKDLRAPVRYGTSLNQNKDAVFCWRDFLKLHCHPLSDVLPYWPSQLREAAVNYSKETKSLYLILVEAIFESLGLFETAKNIDGDLDDDQLKEFEDGSQVIVINCYPPCPEPELTLGITPHSDYGFLTLLLQDEVKGLQIQHGGRWVTVEPIPDSFVVNVGDHLEIFSNGRYRSVLHRVLVNPLKSRISIASLHSLPFSSTIRPSPKLINEANPRLYNDTDFASFLEYLATHEHKNKNFLEYCRRLT